MKYSVNLGQFQNDCIAQPGALIPWNETKNENQFSAICSSFPPLESHSSDLQNKLRTTREA